MKTTQETEYQDPIDALIESGETSIAHVSSGAVSAMVASEVGAQLDAAHKYKRSTTKFLQDARGMATITQTIAESCIYSLPRGGKMLTGPSVRLAEICASAYGNLQIGARVVEIEDAHVVAQGAAWDMERNVRCTIEVRRRITGKNGQRFNDDMITVTGNAAASIALRNAIFRTIPKAYVEMIYDAAKRVAVGDAKTLATRREELLSRFEKIGVSKDRVLERVGRDGIADVTVEDMETLIGLGTAIKNGDATIEDCFPAEAPAPAPKEQDGRRMSLGKKRGDRSEQAAVEQHDTETGESREPGEDG